MTEKLNAHLNSSPEDDNILPSSENTNCNSAAGEYVLHTTTHSMTTGSSVLGLVFNEGVVICADILGSYGSTARFPNLHRVVKINDQTVLCAAGDFSELQYLTICVQQQIADEKCFRSRFILRPRILHSWVATAMYNIRTKLDLRWNVYVVGGMQDGKPFLGLVDKAGTSLESPSISAGFGSHLAQPILHAAIEENPNISEEQAIALLKNCLHSIYNNDATSFPKFTIGIVTKDGVRTAGPVEMDAEWSFSSLVGATVN